MAKNRLPQKSVWATNWRDPSRPGHAHPGDIGAKRVYGRGSKLPTTDMTGEVVDIEPVDVEPEPPAPPPKANKKKKPRIIDRFNPWRS